MNDWEIQAYLYNPKTDEQLDYIVTEPGRVMYDWIRGTDTHRGRLKIYLQVRYLPLGYTERAEMFRDNKVFRAWHGGELINLNKAVRIMKEDLWPEAAQKVSEASRESHKHAIGVDAT